jgi:hypothetical protein
MTEGLIGWDAIIEFYLVIFLLILWVVPILSNFGLSYGRGPCMS